MMNKRCAVCALAALLALALAWPVAAQGGPPPYESYFLYLDEYPSYEENGWSENVQGLTHDHDHWYISQTWELWKIPVTRELASVDGPGGGVSYLNLANVNQLSQYNHAGDLCLYEHEGVDYLVIPLEGGPGPSLGVFRAQTMQYLAHALLPDSSEAGWCAVDPQGYIFTSPAAEVSTLYAYGVNWNHLRATGTLLVQRAPAHDLHLRDSNGQSMTLNQFQGGDFSDGGRLLYLNCGFYGVYDAAKHGIHAFDVATGRQIAHSANGGDPFNYEYDPSCGLGEINVCEEPEGLTVWDLDNGRAPNVWGQLHVLLLDNDRDPDWTPWDPDDVSLKHYSHTIYVDKAYGGDEEKGRFWDPFNTLWEGYGYAWAGSRIGIKAGRYSESFALSKEVALFPFGGPVTLGTAPRMRLSPPATVRVWYGGEIRFH